MSGFTLEQARGALKAVESDAEALQMFSTDYAGTQALPAVGARRRRLAAGDPDPVATVSLVLGEEGVLEWREGTRQAAAPGRRLRRGVAPPPDGELVELYQYEKLEPNKVNEFLTNLDGTLNARRGLWRLQLKGGKVEYAEGGPELLASGAKRRLLFVHGTFSKGEAFFAGIAKAGNGAAFLKAIFAGYDEVLSFEHATLSVSPVLNGYDLFRHFAGASGPLDVVGHSRGGLVIRWFLEGFSGAAVGKGPYRAVLVGSPLGGTGLASPPRLRDSLSMLQNIGTALKVAGAAGALYMPFLTAPLALLKVATSVVSVAAKTPLIDAAVAMIPGLNAQSRVLMHHELDRARAFRPAKPPSYYVVQSNFETEDAGWRFWRAFRKENLADIATNRIFGGHNDLVVDTESMSEFSSPRVAPNAADALDFGTSATVHHVNYFEQAETLDFIRDKLKLK